MGVYIKDMEMPQNCQSCNFYNGLGCKATGRMFPMFYNVAVRRSDCPLIEIPESHGRLIDASEKIRVQMYDEEHEDWYTEEMTIDDMLGQGWIDAEAPTIIPASEEGE